MLQGLTAGVFHSLDARTDGLQAVLQCLQRQPYRDGVHGIRCRVSLLMATIARLM